MSFLLVGVLAIATYAFVVRIPDSSVPGWVLADRREAVQRAIRGQEVIRRDRAREHLPYNTGDRFHTGLIGVAASPIVTELGSLPSKRTSTNPVFAAAVVQMLYQAGVRPGDVVAIGMSGSYPGFDVDAYVGTEAIGADPLVISSIGASQYGATDPDLTWFDMEKSLYDAGVIHHRSIAVSQGGTLSGKTYLIRRTLAERTGLPVVPVLPLSSEAKWRQHLYLTTAQKTGRPIRAFIDVGGAEANVGAGGSESIIHPGLSRPHWDTYQASRLGVTGLMATRRIPIVALFQPSRLAKQYQVPYDPTIAPTARDIPRPPADPIGLAFALVGLIAVVVAFHRLGLFRIPNWELPPALRRRARRPGLPVDPMASELGVPETVPEDILTRRN